jgi:hypothetical protein
MTRFAYGWSLIIVFSLVGLTVPNGFIAEHPYRFLNLLALVGFGTIIGFVRGAYPDRP